MIDSRIRQLIPTHLEQSPGDRGCWWSNRVVCNQVTIKGIPLKSTPNNIILVQRPTNLFITDATFDLCTVEDSLVASFPNQMPVGTKATTDGDILAYDIPGPLPCGGKYYWKITIGTDVWYSEQFVVYTDDTPLYEVILFDDCDVFGININEMIPPAFGWDGFHIYLDPETRLGDITSEEDDRNAENGNADEIPLFKRLECRWSIETGFFPQFYVMFLKLATIVKQAGFVHHDCNDLLQIMEEPEVEITQEENGCQSSGKLTYIFDKVIKKACCDVDETCLPCPYDEAKQVISNTTNQVTAEGGPSVGDRYIVPFNASADPVNNPDWQIHENECAEWNGAGWDYTVPVQGDIFEIIGIPGSPWIWNGTAWLNQFAEIILAGGGCAGATFGGTIPAGTQAFLNQQSAPGCGNISDVAGPYDPATVAAGVFFAGPFFSGDNYFSWRVVNLSCPANIKSDCLLINCP